MTQNHDIRLFQEDEVRAAIQTYFYDQPPSDSGWYMAVNIILAHTLRKRSRMGNSFEYEQYLQNAMGRELQEWRDSIPEMIRPEPTEALVDADYGRLMCLTTLHFTYFQLIVAIHSAAFRLRAADEGNEAESGAIMPSVALCVGASRAAISLLNYHQNGHPFTM